MRYTDGPATECVQHIEASREQVWKFVTDIELPARFSPELRHVAWLDGAIAAHLGAAFEGYNENQALGRWRTVSIVTELTEPTAFAWAVVDADGRLGPANTDPRHPMATWRFELAAENGGTTLRHAVRIGPARSGLNLAIERRPDREEKIIEFRLGNLREGMASTLTGIKKLAEAG